MYKIINIFSPEIRKDMLKMKAKCCNTANAFIFSKRNLKTVRYGLQTMSYMGPKI